VLPVPLKVKRFSCAKQAEEIKNKMGKKALLMLVTFGYKVLVAAISYDCLYCMNLNLILLYRKAGAAISKNLSFCLPFK
jgi:hypothetical protein